MHKSISIHSKACCSLEKKHLVEVLRACDYCTESLEERHQCYKKAAKESGRRARACLIAQ